MSKLVIHRTDNFEYTRSLLEDPEICHAVSDDNSPALSMLPTLDALKVPGYVLLNVLHSGSPVGSFYLFPVKHRVWEIHTLMSRECRGLDALMAGRHGLEHMFEKEDAQTLVSRCPHDNPASLVYAKMLGFKVIRIASDWLRGGTYIDSSHVALDRKEWELCRS